MTRLEELMFKFQDGSASPEELQELTGLLEAREARAALVDDFFMTSAIRSHLRAAPRRIERTRRISVRKPSPTWVWVAAGILVAAFVILLSSSPEETPKPTVRIPTPPIANPEKPAPPKVEPEPPTPPVQAPPPPREAPRPIEPPRPPEPTVKPVIPGPEPAPKPPPSEAPVVPKPVPDPAPQPVRSVVVGVARIDKVEGTAFVVTKEGKIPPTAGSEFAVGQGLETGGAASRIVLAFPDKTQVELGPDSALTDVKLDAGTRLTLASGTIRADIAPQPKTKPLTFITPHAEAKVLGTVLRLVVDGDPKKGTLLEVEKGRVEFKRLSDRKTVIVASGQFAVAAVGVELKAKPLSPNVPMVRFTFDDGKVSPEWVGTIAPGPARPGNTGCLEGKVLPDERLTRVMLSDDNGLFFHRDGAVLSFDYWADGDTQILSIYAWDRTQSLSIGSYEARNLTRKQWKTITIPLGELHAGDKRFQEGDCIKNLTIQTNVGNGILFVDNVEIAVPRAK